MSSIAFIFGLYFLRETNKRHGSMVTTTSNGDEETQLEQMDRELNELEQQVRDESRTKSLVLVDQSLSSGDDTVDIDHRTSIDEGGTIKEDDTYRENGEEAPAADEGEEEKEIVDGQSLFRESQIKSQPASSMRWFGFIRQKLRLENEIFQSYAPLATVAIYAVYGICGTVFNELMPLWLVLKVEDGGLGFVQRQIGIMNAISFVFLLLWSLIFVPRIINRYGCVSTFRCCVIIGALPIVLTPAVNYVASYRALTWLCLIFVYVWRHSCFQAVFASLTMMGNNSVSQSNRGRLNGISQSGVSLTRAIGPVVGTSLFSLSLSVNVFPMNVYFMYFVLTVIYLSLYLWTIKLPKTINAPKLTAK